MYEYKAITQSSGMTADKMKQVDVDALNILGADGWELVAVLPAVATSWGASSIGFNYFFKRKIQS